MSDGAHRGNSDRKLLAIATSLAIVPIVVDAVRVALRGWVPSYDSAPTVLRARHAIGLHPALVGMYTDASLWIGHTTYFPAAWQLYWLWGPTRLLGTTWGPLLSMAALSAIWIGLGAWMVARRLGTRAALLALGFLAVLDLTLGMTALHAATPMIMVVPPFAVFLFGAWALASGDVGVLPAMAALTNFLLLCHLVLTMLVPPILVVAVLGCAVWTIRDVRQDARPRAAAVARLRRPVLWASVVTAVAWLPVVVEQLTNDPGNLANLWHASRAKPTSSITATLAGQVSLSLLTRWPFWLPGSRDRSLFNLARSGQPLGEQMVVAGIGAVVVLVLAVLAVRARDRAGLSALAIATVALGFSWLNMLRSPSPFGLPGQYFLSIWPVSMFVTFAVAFNLLRRLAPRWRRSAAARRPELLVGLGVVAVVALCSLPHTNRSTASTEPTDAQSIVNRKLVREALAAVHGKGPVKLARPRPNAYPSAAALALALDAASVPYCVDGIPQLRGGPTPSCGGFRHDVMLEVYATARPAHRPPGSRVVATGQPLGADDLRRLEVLTRRVRAAVERNAGEGRTITLRPEAVDKARTALETRSRISVDALYRAVKLKVADLNVPGGITRTVSGRAKLADSVAGTSLVVDGREVPSVAIPGIDGDDFLEWSHLEHRWAANAFSIAMVPSD
jgi:hypothetical protein